MTAPRSEVDEVRGELVSETPIYDALAVKCLANLVRVIAGNSLRQPLDEYP